MNLTKKAAAVLLSVLMAIAFMPAVAFAADAVKIDPASGTYTISSGGTYYLDDDFTGQIVVDSSDAVTLSLGTHSVTNTNGDAIVNQGTGTLTITGTGTVTGSKFALGNAPNASCIVNGGTYISTGTSISYSIVNVGTMTINDGVEVTAGAGNVSSLIDNGYANPTVTLGTKTYASSATPKTEMTINGGKFYFGAGGSTDKSPVKNDDFGYMTINGGTFDATTNYPETEGMYNGKGAPAAMNWCHMTINGGSFKGAVAAVSNFFNPKDMAMEPGDLVINGGTFENAGTAYAYGVLSRQYNSRYDTPVNNTPVKVYGGTFNRPLAEGMLANSDIPVAEVTAASTAASTKNTSRAAKVVKRNASTDTETKYAIGEKAIQKAAEQPNVIVEIQSGSVALTNVQAVVRNAATNTTGTVTVDNYQVKANESVAGSAGAAANLQSTINSLQAQLTSALNTNTANTKQIADLKAQIAKAQADLKTVQASLAQAQNDAGKYAAVQQVTEVTAKAGKNKATLTWASLGTNVTGYKIYRKTAGGSYKLVKKITKATTTKWTNKNLKKGKTYYFRIKGYRNVDGGQLWGTSSATVKVKVK